MHVLLVARRECMFSLKHTVGFMLYPRTGSFSLPVTNFMMSPNVLQHLLLAIQKSINKTLQLISPSRRPQAEALRARVLISTGV